MSTTIKRRSFCCTKETEEKLNYLREKWGETTSVIIKRAIVHLYAKTRSYDNIEWYKPSEEEKKESEKASEAANSLHVIPIK